MTISIPMFVHMDTRQVPSTEITVNVYWERKGLLDRLSLSLYISNCTDQGKKKKKKQQDGWIER